jgi:chromosomal replication initiation ATPase DnaA
MRYKTPISKQISQDCENICNFVLNYYSFDKKNIRSRKADYTVARRIMIGMMRDKYKEAVTYDEINKSIGYPSAQSCVNAYKRCLELRKFDKGFSMEYQIVSSLYA